MAAVPAGGEPVLPGTVGIALGRGCLPSGSGLSSGMRSGTSSFYWIFFFV